MNTQINKKLKIAYCIPSLYIHGGMERVVTIKANYFTEVLGHDVFIIMTDSIQKKPFFELSPKVKLINLDVDFEELWCKSIWKKSLLYLNLMRIYKKKLNYCLNEIKPDITVSMLRREINFINDIKDGSKKIGEIHVNRKEFRKLDKENKRGFIKILIQKIWNKQLVEEIQKLDYFVVLTEQDRALWTELNSKKIKTISNPLPFYSPNPSTCTEKSVVIVARYCYQKGFDLLFDAWKKVIEKHPDWMLHIYGENGPEITTYIEELGIASNCKLHPPTSNIEKELIKHSIFVLSSRFEGFGMVLCEAMACGLPCVSFDCHYGPSEIIKHNEDGLLVKDGDTKALAEGLITLIEDEELRKKMGQNAYRNISRMDISKIGKEWESLFYKLLETK
ncbi:MAG: glycosyltransferase family 4 protein [Phocaeicola sp.]